MTKVFVLDTNVLLHDPQAMLGFEDHEVVIPIYVISEVDNFKKDLSELGRNARHAARLLDALRIEGNLTDGVPTDSGGKVRVTFTKRELPPELAQDNSVDDRILAGHTTSPTTVDWDRDGIRDLLVGAEDGFLYYMKNPHRKSQ